MPFSLPKKQIGQWLLFSMILGGGLWLTQPLLTSELRTLVGLIIAAFFVVILAWITDFRRALL